MSLVKISGNATGTGIFTIAAPSGNTDRTLTLPDSAGTFNVSGAVNEVPAGSASAPSIYPTGDTNTGIFFPAADTIAFAEGGAEAARIDSSGNVLVGTTAQFNSCKQALVFNGATHIGLAVKNSDSATGQVFIGFYNSAGTNIGAITQNATTTVNYATSSDYRLKEDVQPMQGALARVALLKPVTYKWKSDGSDGEGFIAHELAEVCPDAVVGEKDAVYEDGTPRYQGIDTSFLVATLTAAIQELKAELDSVKTELATLKGAA
jgi:hypothetical protein